MSIRAKNKRILCIKPEKNIIKGAVYEDSRCLYKELFQRVLPSGFTDTELEKERLKIARQIQRWIEQDGGKKVDVVSVPFSVKTKREKRKHGKIMKISEMKNGRIVSDYKLITEFLKFSDKGSMNNAMLPLTANIAEALAIPAFAIIFFQEIRYPPESTVSGYSSIVLRATSPNTGIEPAVRKAVQIIGRPAEDINLVVSILGETHVVAAVVRNQIVDSTITPLGSGPFSLRQTGQLPMKNLIELCFSKRFSHNQILEELSQRGGVYFYLKEDCFEAIEKKIKDGDERAVHIMEAMIYQISKEIGKMFVAAGCDVEAIVLSGEMISSQIIKDSLRHRIGRLAPVFIFEGLIDMEMLSETVSEIL